MRIVVEHIPENGQDVTFDATTRWAVDAASRAVDAPLSALAGQLTVVRNGSRVGITGHVAVAARRACERCGEDVELAFDVDPDLTYVPAAKAAIEGEEEVELGEADLDVGWYEEGEIDMGDVLCEAVALAMPARVACADVAACDARTAKLLDKADPGDGARSESPFAVLKNRK